jgi:threonine dehydrogenase-like Zn-dependent dehydrogenase
MRAARYYGKEDIRVEEIEEPGCGEGQIKVKPAFVGICGTGTKLPTLLSTPQS